MWHSKCQYKGCEPGSAIGGLNNSKQLTKQLCTVYSCGSICHGYYTFSTATCGESWMNEWMMHLYCDLLCISVHPVRFTIMWGGGGLSSSTTSVQHPLGWCDGSHRITAPEHPPHTSYRWRGEREIEPIKWMRVIRRPWLTRASGGNFEHQNTGVTPILFMTSAMEFLMTTESRDLGLMSHPKDGACW